MTAKLLLVVVTATLATVAATRSGQEKRDPTAGSLQSRVESYYSSMKQARFEDTWAFFTAQARLDSPREQYAKDLRESKTLYELVAIQKISVTPPSGQSKTSEGFVIAALKVTSATQKPIPAAHRTTWRWQSIASTPPDWYLVSQELTAPRTTTSSSR